MLQISMANAFPSSLAASTETTNGVKLRRLLVDGGTTVLRKVFDRRPPTDLAAKLRLNSLTLDDLFARGFLNEQQRNCLYPSDGSKPDSKTFDITLLFLLLTEICGLSPPARTGWSHKPHAKDKSLAANLVRIKLFRNKLLHTPETRIDSRLFHELWKEISSVLVSLGLDQAEINRLKAERCGEEDYLDVLFKWADREKEVKSKLEEVCQSQTKMQKAVETIGQAQQEQQKILQDTITAVETVGQTQQEQQKIHQDTKTAVETVRQTQQEQQKIHQDTKTAVETVSQTQQEQQKILQDTKTAVETVGQNQQEQQKVLQDTKKAVETAVAGMVKSQERLVKSFEDVRQVVDSLKEGRDEDSSDQVLRNLTKSEFKGDIEYHIGRYQEGTREWVFNEVRNWLDNRNSENRVMVISSSAGMGKTVISAVVCKRMQEAGRLSGSHFCQHNNARYRNPQLMLQSLSCHLCHGLPEYKEALVKQLSRNLGKDLNNMGVEELFALLFKEPLSTVADPGRNMLMVIDGLDESEYQERNELLDVLANHLSKLPCWIRFLCTTRPERNISEALKHLKPFQLESNDDKNMEDIKRFIENRTQYLIKPDTKGAIVEKLVAKSEGLMLYAYFLVLFIEENSSILDQGNLDYSLPLAISSVYHSYFKRLENELKKELGVNEENFLNLLCAVIASREPMPIDFVSKLLGPNASSPLARRKVLKAISSVSSLLPIRDGCLDVFHKSVKDWLTDTSCYGEHDFTMDEKEGHRILASLCGDELDHLKQKGVRSSQFSSTEKYALHHGVRHMLQLDENMGSRSLEECVRTYVTDLELLHAKICVNNSTAAEEILWLQSQELFRTVSANTRDLLNTLMLLVRKHFSTLTDNPHLVLQTLLNEGGRILSPMASNILQKKYPEIPCMEFVNKQMQQGAVLAGFECSSFLLCFDVSPQLDYMVCECENGAIQLWSLHTGELLWTRPVKVMKCQKISAFRQSTSSFGPLSFYRSVVFHPTEKVVIPGVLSHGYDFNGDLKPLFPESHCSFTVCSVSGGKCTMLTDCPDDGKSIIMWSLKNGSEMSRITRDEDILSFACSRDGQLLAISHSSGLIAIVDAMDGFRTLGQTDLLNVCGVIKFSPDSRSLLCFHFALTGPKNFFRLNINLVEHLTCRVDVLEEPIVTWESESRSEGGFLLGDPFWYEVEEEATGIGSSMKFYFVLDKHTVLRSGFRHVKMLNMNDKHQREREAAPTNVLQIVFSLSGETIYIASHHDHFSTTTVTAWDVSSSELIAEKKVDDLWSSSNCLLAVKGGVLIIGGIYTLQMWNFELSKCVRCWTNIGSVTDVLPISDERVACATKEGKVISLDTTSGEILSTTQIGLTSNLLACNSKFLILTLDANGSLRLSDRKNTRWEKQRCVNKFARFSPAEMFVISYGYQMDVLDAFSGKRLHVFGSKYELWPFLDCEFVSDEECVVISKSYSLQQCHVQLFNVKSGDLLSNLPLSTLPLSNLSFSTHLQPEVNCVAVSPCKPLVAITQTGSKHGYELMRVRLPGDEDSRKSKW